MARPIKKGLDYFPVDVGIMADKKLRRIKMEYGHMGFSVYFALLCLIYEDEGYFIDYSDNNKDDVIWGIMEYLQGRHQPTAETIAEVIERLVACELFSGEQFSSNILTSKRIQSTYYMATVERKTIDVNFDIWLLSEEEMRAMSKSSVLLRNFVNRPINQVNRPINQVNRPINPQRERERERERESKAEEKTAFSAAAVDSKTRCHGFAQNVPLTDEQLQELIETVEDCEGYINRVSQYISNKGRSYNNCFETIIKWAKQDGKYRVKSNKTIRAFPVFED